MEAFDRATRLWDSLSFQYVYMFNRPVYDSSECCIAYQATNRRILVKKFRGRIVFNKMQIHKIMKGDKK
jgi:hypothetical protein